MVFCLLILCLVFILINSIAYNCNVTKIFFITSFFISIFFLLGVCSMKEKGFKIVAFVLSCVVVICIMVYLGFIIFTKQPKNVLSTDNEHFYLNGQKLENVYILSNSDAKISEGIKNVIVMDTVILESQMIDDNAIKILDKIYFLSTKPTVDSALYEKIKDKIKYISSQNQCLIINFEKDNSQ